MSRTLVPLAISDVSAFAKSLRSQFEALARQPSHVELLNMLARAAGRRNFQQLRAEADSLPAAAPVVDHDKVEKVLRHFDADGRMLRWPGRTSHQQLCLWAIWARIPAGQRMGEAEMNGFIKSAHTFGDHAILRRSMVDAGLLVRTPDGRIYRRIEQLPPPEAIALMRVLSGRAQP